ncbi:MAG: hypothetical protein ACXWKP_17780, partial [Bradyrhizobium sp.]
LWMRRLLSMPGILAVVGWQKECRGRFISPNRFSSSSLTVAKIAITFLKVASDGRLCMFNIG